MSEYVLQVGDKGFDRLKFLNDIFGPYSRDFLARAGLAEGNCVLELGCGTGCMTSWLAKTVGHRGRVIAVDARKEQIELAQKAVRQAGCENVEFVCSTVESMDLPEGTIDIAYSRLLLMHLKDPRSAVNCVRKCLRSGGILACEEPQASSLNTEPRNEAIEKLNVMFIACLSG
jgi:ubiquinone/menaquinone biosynthesis C-methylase UbiE